MHAKQTAATALLGALLSTSIATASDTTSTRAEEERQSIDEIVVSGRHLSSRDASIIVEQEFMVDVAEALSRLPGASRNQNGRLSGIAQYRGMFGDRVSVSIDGFGVIGGGPNSMDAPLSYVSPMITERLVLERGIPGVASAPESIGGHVDAAARADGFDEGVVEGFELLGVLAGDDGHLRAQAVFDGVLSRTLFALDGAGAGGFLCVRAVGAELFFGTHIRFPF